MPFIVLLLVIALLVSFWQYILIGLGLWALGAMVWHFTINSEPRPRPVARPVQPKPVPKPMPARELPAPGYLRRWPTDRRLAARQELADWQGDFDRELARRAGGLHGSSTAAPGSGG